MNALKLQKRFPQLDQGAIFSLQDAFNRLDVEDRGYLDESTAIKAAQQSERQPYDVVRAALKDVELDSSRRVELEDYVDLVAKLRTAPSGGAPASTPAAVIQGAGAGTGASRHVSKGSVGGRIHVQGSSSNVTHTINEDERTEFTRHINAVLAGDADIGDSLPFPTDTFEMFDKCKDGLVLAKLINDSVPDTIDERVLNKAGKKIKQLNAFHMTENNNIVINSAKGIGCSVVNIGSGDIIEVREHLILGLIWQIIRRGLLGKIDIKLHPELYRLLDEDETLEQFLRLPPEQILLRWFNYHLKNAKWDRRVTNFSTDVKDGENYTVLLNQLAPDVCSRGPLQTQDLLDRAEQVLKNADSLDCRKFLTPASLVAGNPKLNLAFVANLFNTHPGLDPITEEEKLEVEDFDAEGEREARVFTLWLNSLDVQPAVNSLFDDLRDGFVLLQAYDKVIPGSVNWRHVNKPPASGGELMRFKAVENTNYSIELGKFNGFSLVGVQGADITDGQRTLTLGLVWQLMRRDITNTLSALAQRLGKREITDTEMIKWANDMSSSGGRSSTIRSFKDKSIGSGVFLLDVLCGMKSSYVDYDLVTPGRTDEEAYANAKLSISIARKMGATIWLVPEDICQVRSRLVTTFIVRLEAEQPEQPVQPTQSAESAHSAQDVSDVTEVEMGGTQPEQDTTTSDAQELAAPAPAPTKKNAGINFLDHFLQFLYTRDYTIPETATGISEADKTEENMLHHARTYTLAEKLGLPALKSLAHGKIHKIKGTPAAELAYARYVYTHTPADDTNIRKPVASHWANQSHVLRHEVGDDFQKLCIEVPQFSFDVLSIILDRKERSSAQDDIKGSARKRTRREI
ncbi:unnamed protein product [Penicillium olsonii]|nr:unnamed protein product [Penicillium olsonii]CAG7932104.1 unnamed protein product [Penicillium olsonii]